MAKLTSMRNIGKEMARKLAAAGISSSGELIGTGSKQAFFQLKALYPQVCLVHLYALESAIQDVDFNALSKETKADLKGFSDLLTDKGGAAL